MLIQTLAKGKKELDPSTLQATQQAISSALYDTDEGVKIDTLKAMAKFGGEDMIPALTVVAERDPAVGQWATEAILAIQQRTHPAKINPVDTR